MADFILKPAGKGAHTIQTETAGGLLFLEFDWHNKGRVEADELPYFAQCCRTWGLTFTTESI